MRLAFELGCTLCALDFAGSGRSQGEYVSLGAFEQHDCRALCEHLRATKRARTLLLWGRSMGAVTALLCGARNEPGVVGVVADSPFSSLRALCYDLVAKATAGVAGEGLLVDAVLGMVASSVRHRAGFDLDDCDALRALPAARAPALFIHGLRDDFIAPKVCAGLLPLSLGDEA